jgi:hypothetical protein
LFFDKPKKKAPVSSHATYKQLLQSSKKGITIAKLLNNPSFCVGIGTVEAEYRQELKRRLMNYEAHL